MGGKHSTNYISRDQDALHKLPVVGDILPGGQLNDQNLHILPDNFFS